jgi:acetylornithine deacetylase/succinyl-diaminopimelate desuccinylase-like protein
MAPGDVGAGDAPVELLRRLVAARSPNPPGDERAIADAIEREAAALGLPQAGRFARDPKRPNLIFELGDGSPTFILAAHMDTVPAIDIPSWRSDPWQLTEVDGRLVGLGSSDMKGAIAAMLLASARWLADPSRQGTVKLVFAADEENFSAYGMEYLAREGLLSADAAVLTEPASLGERSWERFFVAQRGSCVCRLEARGEPGHSGALIPKERRASWAFARALNALLDADLFADRRHPVDGTGVTVNVATVVEGGTVPIAHPEVLRCAIDVRTIEGMTEQLVLEVLRDVIDRAGLADRVTIEPAAPPSSWFDPGWTASDERLLKAARTAWREVLGSDAPSPSVMTAGTDSTHINAAGIQALPAFGPGSLAVAHKPNESIAPRDLFVAVDLFEALIRAYMSDE